MSSLALRLARFAGLALTLTSAAFSQTTLFSDDFEAGLANWSATSLWHVLLASSNCALSLDSFPCDTQCAAFNQNCRFLGTPAGDLTLLAPISIPSGATSARLRFRSFEATECGFGNCGWDHRYVFVSADGGQQWQQVAVGDIEYTWNERVVSLNSFIGSDILIRFSFDAIDDLWNDFPGWMVDDVVVETDWLGTSYCTSKINSEGCSPYVLATGHPSLSGPDDLTVTAELLVNQTMSKLVWSRASASTPFHGGILCVQAPAARTNVTSSGGTPGAPGQNCSGSYSFTFTHAYLATKAVTAGQTLYIQASTRDPGYAVPNNHSLSNAISITIVP